MSGEQLPALGPVDMRVLDLLEATYREDSELAQQILHEVVTTEGGIGSMAALLASWGELLAASVGAPPLAFIAVMKAQLEMDMAGGS